MKKRSTFITLVLLTAALIAATASAFAASAKLSVSGGGTVNVGDTVSVTFTYSGATFGSATTEIRYDASVLEYKSCTATAGGGSGVVTVTTADGNGVKSLSATVSFKAKAAGSSTVTATPVTCENYNFEALSASAASTSVSVKNPATQASGNANLSSLWISAGTLSPAFSPNTTSYTINVGNDITACSVDAATAHSKATWRISGSPTLSVGTNVRTITVTAENGTTKKYTLTINRAAAGSKDDEPEEEPEDKRPDELKTSVGDKEYVICEDLGDRDIPEGFSATAAKFDKYDIPVVKDKELKYALALLKDSETGDERWFFYDEEKDEFSETARLDADTVIRYEEALFNASAADTEEEEPQEEGISTADKTLFLIFGATAAALLILIIVLQIKILRSRSQKNDGPENDDLINDGVESGDPESDDV